MIHSICVGMIATNCYMVPDSKSSVLLIDPGADAEMIIAQLKKMKRSVSAIILTHGHFDHCGALKPLRDALNQSEIPPVMIHRSDAEYLGTNALSVHTRDFKRVGADAWLRSAWLGVYPADRYVDEGDRIGSFKVIHTPGHSAGSICLYDEKAGVLLSGDTLFRSGVGRTDLPGGDADTLRCSLERLLSLPPGTKVYPGHGDSTRIRNEQNLPGLY